MTMLEVVSSTSIQVSWDRLDIPEITGYIVYYSQTENSTTVSDAENSVTIDNLLTNVEYQFQVVAVAELDGDVITGVRSNVSIAHPTPPPHATPASPAATEGQCESEHAPDILYV